MGILHTAYRATRQLPLLRNTSNLVMRAGRNLFWSLRPAYMAGSSAVPADYVSLIVEHIADASAEFKLIEVGCGDGRVLKHLAEQFPLAQFVGVDLQKAAIELGNKSLSEPKVQLIVGSCLDNSISMQCEYLISRAALIYLDSEEIKSFLRKRLPQVAKRAILQELVSTTGKTEYSHFFAHPLAELVEEIAPCLFDVSQHILPYEPWKGQKWTGANVVISRKSA